MAAKIPLDGLTETCTLMSHGYNPYLIGRYATETTDD